MKNRVIAYIIFIILVMLFWLLYDYLFTTFITHNVWSFNPYSLFMPLVVGIAMGYWTILKRRV